MPDQTANTSGATVEENMTQASGTTSSQIVTVSHPSPQFTAVEQLWRRHRQVLGFMPTAGFSDRAERGTLLAAVANDQVVGYVLFDLPGDIVKIIHLCVDPSERGSGVARCLTDEVSRRYKDYQGVQLSCRRDHEASRLWRRLGFIYKGERPGRGSEGKPLTIWFRDHGHGDLFTYSREQSDAARPAAALDYNIVIDLLTDRPQGEDSRNLFDDWIDEQIVLCITDESFQETERSEDAIQRTQMLQGMARFTRLPPSSTGFEHLVESVASMAPRVGRSDHRHLAYAIAGKASYFVTRDSKIIEYADVIRDRFDIRILRPEPMITELDRSRSESRYAPEALNETSFTVDSTVDEEPSFVQAFLNFGGAERRSELAAVLRAALARPQEYELLVVRDSDGRYRGCALSHRDENALIVDTLRVASPDRLGHAIARQLCYLQRQAAADERVPTVRIADRHPSPSMIDALAAEGYKKESEQWVCSVDVGLREASESCEPDIATPTNVAQYERWHWPAKLTGAGLATFMVPIRPPFAEQLFDTRLAADTLFGCEELLGLSREHVYYRSPLTGRGLASPARLLWYVSGRTQSQSQGHLRALSQLAEVRSGHPKTMFRRFERLGVYSEREVVAAASDNDQVMALRFVNTELFDTPLSLNQARETAEDLGETFHPPRSPFRVSDEFFASVYRQVSSYAY